MELIKIILIAYLLLLAGSAVLPSASLFRTIITVPFRIFFSAFRLIVSVVSLGKMRIPASQRRISAQWKKRIASFNSAAAESSSKKEGSNQTLESWKSASELKIENESKPMLPWVGEEDSDESDYR